MGQLNILLHPGAANLYLAGYVDQLNIFWQPEAVHIQLWPTDTTKSTHKCYQFFLPNIINVFCMTLSLKNIYTDLQEPNSYMDERPHNIIFFNLNVIQNKIYNVWKGTRTDNCCRWALLYPQATQWRAEGGGRADRPG